MSQPKQIKFGRRRNNKRSGKALTDIGYNVTLDTSSRVNCDYNIRTPNGKAITLRENLEVMDLHLDSLKAKGSCGESAGEYLSDIQYTKAIDKLANFKQSNRLIQGQRKGDLDHDVTWTQHFTDRSRKVVKCSENETQPLEVKSENHLQVYENFFYGCKHWNFFCVDGDIGVVIVSLKMEVLHGKEHVRFFKKQTLDKDFHYSPLFFRRTSFNPQAPALQDNIRILVRSSLCSIHAVVALSSLGVSDHHSDPYSWIDTLTLRLQLTKPLQLITHHTVGSELVKLDRVFVKSEFKIGLLYLKHGQKTEDEIFSNTSHSHMFETFLGLLGERITLKGFTGYSGGLDTSNGLNGTQSLYTKYRNNKIMFHVPTLMPNSANDLKHLGKKRHVGNDVLCVIFTDKAETTFSPSWIKSQFIYAYILVQIVNSPNEPLSFKVSVICREEVPWFGPCLPGDGIFEKGNEFREWLLKKIINGDRACYKAPKFASVQQRTRCQIMNGILEKEMTRFDEESSERRWMLSVTHNNNVDQSDSLDGLQSLFPDKTMNCLEDSNPKLRYFYFSQNDEMNSGDVTFLAGKTYKKRIYGVRSVMCCKSRVFRDMLTDGTIPRNESSNNLLSREDSLVKLAFKKVKSQTIIQSNSRKGKFAIETSSHKLPAVEEHVTTTSIKRGGKTYEISLDCIGRTREFVMNEFEADIFSGVIDYIHNDKCTITHETLPGLLCAATYYELPELRLSCLNRQNDVITTQTVCSMLNIVEEYVHFKDGKELQQKLLQFFVNYLMEIMNEDYFTILSKSRIILVLSQDWKCEKQRKVKVASVWAKFRDFQGWRSLAKSLLSSCSQVMDTMLDDTDLDLFDDFK